MTVETNMREVVARLRAEGSEAILELLEFDHALEAFLDNLEQAAPTLQELHRATSELVRGGEKGSQWTVVQDQANRLDVWMRQFLPAFRELRSSVRTWNITHEPSASSPNNGKRERPKG